MTISHELAKYVCHLSFESIPDLAKEDCKNLILDTLGVAIGGSRTKHAEIIAGFVEQNTDRKEATVIGYGFKTSCLNAALANGLMAHSIDFDDDYEAGGVHVGCAVIPAALAIGEVNKISGLQLMNAVIAGYDVSCRVALAIFPRRTARRGYHTTGLVNPFGAAAAAGKVLNLSEEQLVNAFGVAGDQASGLLQYHFDGTMLKHFHGGKAAQNGLLSALLAQRGFTGSPEIFEGKYGYCKFVGIDDYELGELTKGLGQDFRVSTTGIKPYPSCRVTNAAIDAALMLKRQHNIDAGNIESVIVRTYGRAFDSYNKPSPDTVLQSLLSEQYTVAAALVKDRVTLEEFTPESIRDSSVRELMRKIELVEDEELTRIFKGQLDRRPHELEIFMKNGEHFTQRVLDPKGSANNRITSLELIDKFDRLASTVLSKSKVKKLAKSIQTLEKLDDITELAELVQGPH